MDKEKLIEELVRKTFDKETNNENADFYILGLSNMYDYISDKLSAKDEAISNLKETSNKLRSDLNSQRNELERTKKLVYGFQSDKISILAAAKHFALLMKTIAYSQEVDFLCQVFADDFITEFDRALKNLKPPVLFNLSDEELPF